MKLTWHKVPLHHFEMKTSLTSLLAAALLSLGGCDSGSVFPDGPIEATGRVVLAETGEPIAGLGVALLDIPPSFGATFVRASTRTDANGRFSLRYVVPPMSAGSSSTYEVTINDVPHDTRYTSFAQRVTPPTTLDLGTVEIRLREAP